MKKFCVLEQGKLVGDDMFDYHADLFNTSISDLYRLNWKTHDDPDAFRLPALAGVKVGAYCSIMFRKTTSTIFLLMMTSPGKTPPTWRIR